MDKEKIKSLVIFVATWLITTNVLYFLFSLITKTSYQFDMTNCLFVPLLSAIIAWIILFLKPWKEDNNE